MSARPAASVALAQPQGEARGTRFPKRASASRNRLNPISSEVGGGCGEGEPIRCKVLKSFGSSEPTNRRSEPAETALGRALRRSGRGEADEGGSDPKPRTAGPERRRWAAMPIGCAQPEGQCPPQWDPDARKGLQVIERRRRTAVESNFARARRPATAPRTRLSPTVARAERRGPAVET